MNSCHSGSKPKHSKNFSIIVNGRRREVEEHKLTYIEVVQLAFPGEEPSEQIIFTVTFSNRHGKEGSLVAGEKVRIKNGMVFNVDRTDKS